jgi:hypothetical protein
MNPHILFVIDHLANPDKYTQEELDANYESARSAADAYHDFACWAASAADDDDSAYWAASASAADDSAAASHWVDEHFKLTGEDKQAYIDKLRDES